MHTRYTRPVALLAVALAALVAAVGATAAPSTPKVDSITIGIPGIPPIFMAVREEVALKDGFYEKYGINVNLQGFTTGVDAVKAVQAGQIDAAWAPTPFALSLMAKGVPLVAIEGLDVVDWVIVSDDPSISCGNLKGQTIAVDTVGGARYAALQAMLKHCNLTINDVKTVNFPGDAATQAMLAGQLKLAVMHYDELAQLQRTGHKTPTVIASMTQVDPNQHYDMMVVQRSTLQSKYADFVKVLAGDIAAVRYMYQPKNLTNVAKIATITGRDEATAKIALQKYFSIKWWPESTAGLGYSKITRTIGLNVKLGNISPSAGLTWAKVVDTKPWKQALALVDKNQKKKK